MSSSTRPLLAWAAAAAVVGAVIVPFPVPRISGELSQRAHAGWELSVSSAHSRISLLRGTSLTDVSVRATSPQLLLTADVETLLLDHQWFPIPPLAVHGVTLVRPNIEMTVGSRPDSDHESREQTKRLEGTTSAPPSSSSLEDGFGADYWLEFRDAGLSLEHATLVVRPSGVSTTPWRISGLTLTLGNLRRDTSAADLLAALSAAGGFNADQLQVGEGRIGEMYGELRIEAGHILVTDLNFTCGAARLRLPELDIDFINEPFALTTRNSILERAQTSPDSEPEWVPIRSLTEVSDRCR